MTKITRKGLLEEMGAISKFNYGVVHKQWLEFCKTRPDGKQSLEELSMLVTSLTDNEPWRVTLSKPQVQEISKFVEEAKQGLEQILTVIREKLETNELISGDV